VEISRLNGLRRSASLGRLVRVLAALALAGCGASAGAQTATGPLVKFPDLGYHPVPPHLAHAVPPSAVLVDDLTNTASVAPAAMRVASDTTFGGARWSGWGGPSATGHGIATVRICKPDCGGGHDVRYHATLVLSAVKACGAHRFYERVRLTLSTVDGPRQWGAVVTAPC
jgi:hypothetical protein